MWKLVRRNCLTGGKIYETKDGFGKAYEIIAPYNSLHRHFSLYLGGEFMGYLDDIGSAP